MMKCLSCMAYLEDELWFELSIDNDKEYEKTANWDIRYFAITWQKSHPKHLANFKGTCLKGGNYMKLYFKKKRLFASIFLDIFSPYEHVLATLSKNQKVSFICLYSSTCFCCHYGTLKNNFCRTDIA